MKRTTFSSGEIVELKKNPCVFNCTAKSVHYTYEFKRHALELYSQGISPKEIWRRAGFDVSKWGKNYFVLTLRDWKRIVARDGEEGLNKLGGLQYDRGPSKGRIGEMQSSLLGSLLVTGFELAALSRSDSPPESREDFCLYVDEFQNCATDSFASILSEARKYGLSLTLAHQYMGQLNEQIRDAVFGNVGTLVSFRVGEADASILERQFGGQLTGAHFTGLENFELCARLLNKEPFLGKSLPPLATDRRRREVIIRRSRQKYCKKGSTVENKIERWLKGGH